MAMGASATDLTSFTRLLWSKRRIPKKLMANNFTKQVTASAAVRASPAPHRAKTIFANVEESSAERSIVCKVSHSLTKPLKGGSAATESVPARKKKKGERDPFFLSPTPHIFA